MNFRVPNTRAHPSPSTNPDSATNPCCIDWVSKAWVPELQRIKVTRLEVTPQFEVDVFTLSGHLAKTPFRVCPQEIQEQLFHVKKLLKTCRFAERYRRGLGRSGRGSWEDPSPAYPAHWLTFCVLPGRAPPIHGASGHSAVVPQCLRGTGSRHPPHPQRYQNAQIPYVKWHGVCISPVFVNRLQLGMPTD